MTSKKLIVIDTDPGMDDAEAILMALADENVKVVALTLAQGNVSLDQVSRNALRILKVADRLDIPVYRGCQKPLLGNVKNATYFHGKDGLGDTPDPTAPGLDLVKKDHAVTMLIQLARENEGNLTLVCLAPLTNVAMAIRMDPSFGENLKACYMYGGGYEGKGNMTGHAEYNFHADPEAANVTLTELKCPITMCCWELTLKYAMTWDSYNTLRSTQDDASIFLKRINENSSKQWDIFLMCDHLTMACALNPDVIANSFQSAPTVELYGQTTRGQMCIDYRVEERKDKTLDHVTIVTELNEGLLKEILSCVRRLPIKHQEVK